MLIGQKLTHSGVFLPGGYYIFSITVALNDHKPAAAGMYSYTWGSVKNKEYKDSRANFGPYGFLFSSQWMPALDHRVWKGEKQKAPSPIIRFWDNKDDINKCWASATHKILISSWGVPLAPDVQYGLENPCGLLDVVSINNSRPFLSGGEVGGTTLLFSREIDTMTPFV